MCLITNLCASVRRLTHAHTHPFSHSAHAMSDKFVIEPAKTGRSTCKECKVNIAQGDHRIGKVKANPFSGDGGAEDVMTTYYHTKCFFTAQLRSRAATAKVEDTSDLEGFHLLGASEKSEIKKLIDDWATSYGAKKPAKSKPAQPTLTAFVPRPASDSTTPPPSATTSTPSTGSGEDASFFTFTFLCDRVAAESSHTGKTKIIKDLIERGGSGKGFTGDVFVTLKLLLPMVSKRVYNMKDKQIIKAFSSIFSCSLADMETDLEKGDCPETIAAFFLSSPSTPPQQQSTLTMAEVGAPPYHTMIPRSLMCSTRWTRSCPVWLASRRWRTKRRSSTALRAGRPQTTSSTSSAY